MSDGDGTEVTPVRSGSLVSCSGLERHLRPEDTYAGTSRACAEAIDAGIITTVHDWAACCPAPADRPLRLLKDIIAS
jgi:hypothetical protein